LKSAAARPNAAHAISASAAPWPVPALGDSTHGFPHLSGAGRLALKDIIMMGAALVTMADSASADLRSAERASKATVTTLRRLA
jgi:hypothetical protein